MVEGKHRKIYSNAFSDILKHTGFDNWRKTDAKWLNEAIYQRSIILEDSDPLSFSSQKIHLIFCLQYVFIYELLPKGLCWLNAVRLFGRYLFVSSTQFKKRKLLFLTLGTRVASISAVIEKYIYRTRNLYFNISLVSWDVEYVDWYLLRIRPPHTGRSG